jgi:hypothetical protein
MIVTTNLRKARLEWDLWGGEDDSGTLGSINASSAYVGVCGGIVSFSAAVATE